MPAQSITSTALNPRNDFEPRAPPGSSLPPTGIMVPVIRSAISLSPRTVIIDYGEVISHSPSAADRAALEELAGVDRAKFWAAYWAHRPALDLAVEGVREYWAAIKADTGADWDDGRVCELWLADF